MVSPQVGSPSALKPQKSSTSGSLLQVSDWPTACPLAFTLNVELLAIPTLFSRGRCAHPYSTERRRPEPSVVPAPPAIKWLSLTKNG